MLSPLPGPVSQVFAGPKSRGQVTANFHGSYALQVTASDTQSSASSTFVLTIDPVNDVPVLVTALTDQASAEDTTWSFTIPAGTFADVDTVLTPTATLSSGASLPSWLSFDGTTFYGTPPLDSTEPLDIIVTAFDGEFTVSSTFRLTITGVNDAPVVSGPVVLTGSAEDEPRVITAAELLANASDIDTDTASLSIRDLVATSGSFTDNGNGSWTFTPDQNSTADVSFSYNVFDGTALVAATATLSLSPLNDAPEVAVALTAQSTAEEAAWSYTVPAGTFSDVDHDQLTYRATAANGGALPSWLTFDTATRTFSGTPPAGAMGDFIFDVSGSDGLASAISRFTLTVTRAAEIVGSALADTLTGMASAERILGLAGNDTLNGAGGADTLVGGADNDTYSVDDAAAQIVEAADGGYDTVYTTLANYTLADNVEAVSGGQFVTGNALDNTYLTWSAITEAANGGIDTVIGSVFVPTFSTAYTSLTLAANVENADITIGVERGLSRGGAFISGNELDNTIRVFGANFRPNTYFNGSAAVYGGAGNDTITVEGGASASGDDGNDSLTGGAGLSGGAGNDTLSNSSYLDGGDGDDLLTNGTHQYGGIGNDTIQTGAGANGVFGDAGADSIVGGTGKDLLSGGADNDTIRGGSERDIVWGDAGEDSLYGDAGDDDLFGGAGNDSLLGGAGNNWLSGDGGNDTLDGTGGTSTMKGGYGDDLYVVDDGTDTVEEFDDEGSDTIRSSVFFDMARTGAVEHLVLTGSAAIGAIGNGYDNHITGNGAANWLRGLGGNDTLLGGFGADTLEGGSGDDRLVGGGGNDRLIGGTGTDTFVGGLGNDVYVVLSSDDVVTELAGQGVDRVEALGSHTLADNVENLTLTGGTAHNGTGNTLNNVIVGNDLDNRLIGLEGNDKLSGNDGSDSLYGGDGNDTLEGNSGDDLLLGNDGNDRLIGGFGDDTLIGGLGNDVYVIQTSGDVVMELAGEGTDLVEALVSTTLDDNVENLTLMPGHALLATGNASNNTIRGNELDNRLQGLAGADRLYSGLGVDTLAGGDGNDILYAEGSGGELRGGAGNDIFDFANAITGTYSVMDFIRGDRIDVTSIDADQGMAGDQVFAFLGEAAFSGQAGQLRFIDQRGQGSGFLVQMDADGDRHADFTLMVNGGPTKLVATDFRL
jgi:Ca2+-binding RTX toxin-like protein